ncbi:MAG TPA: AbrB/MazE/SpoVT family DNA-binding domain-containing protein [Firmicutes bacterium]|nr:AbrB/MazE/SpoVT family DNA-binding domain-containing protein [Bacillota bacterium]
MKSTGIVRKVDELGRIVLPIELRRTLDINKKDSIEIFVEGNQVILKKYQPACVFCGNASDIFTFGDKNVCRKCLNKMNTMYANSK